MSLARIKHMKNAMSGTSSSVWIIVLFAGISFVSYSLLFNNVLLFDGGYFLNMSFRRRAVTDEPQRKLILLYTMFFGKQWPDYPTLGPTRPPMVEGSSIFEGCEVPTCTVTYNKEKILQADAVGFHARDMPKSLPLNRSAHQVWFYFVLENPWNVVMDKSGFANVFNWTMSYRRESEIYTPYGKYTKLREPQPKLATENYTVGKDRLIAWLVSNCNEGERMEYVRELGRHIDVSIYGECGDFHSCPRKRRSRVCYSLLRRYKFYLAFENGNCPDYITEKYWENAIDNEIVPVVMGGANYKELAIPNSYIDVRDFESPKTLAEYLLYLDRNDTEYNKYFSWKRNYRHIAPQRACTLCRQLHNESLLKTPRTYRNMEQFWAVEQCYWLNLVE